MGEIFSSARQLLRWANEDIKSLEAASETFLRNNPYSFRTEFDSETGETLLKLKMAPVPNEICKLASHALWDIKHALDHATCAAVVAAGGTQDVDIHFPIRSHLNDFNSALKATVKKSTALKYPALLHDTLRSFEPYPTGNGYSGGSDDFCALSKLANTTKHSIALAAVPQFDIASISDSGAGGVEKDFRELG
jgi:hypothetical protein